MLDVRLASLALAVAACGRSSDRSQNAPVTSEQVTLALEGTYGVHPGDRRNHAKGTCAVGTFVGLPHTRAYSRSRMFTGEPIPVTARFSVAGGDPDAADTERSVRGMGLELKLPDGSFQHFTMINAPMFFAATPQTFLDKMVSLKPDPATGKPDPARQRAFAETHPDAEAMTSYMEKHNPPPSWANAAYYGVHTFHFIRNDGHSTSVKFRFVPGDGVLALSDAELASKPTSFLEQALLERVKRGPVTWDMWITIGERGDNETDPTVLWPANRKEIRAGTLTLTAAMPDAGGPCERINYDPLELADGIAPSADPVLLFRSPSYNSSANRRLRGL